MKMLLICIIIEVSLGGCSASFHADIAQAKNTHGYFNG